MRWLVLPALLLIPPLGCGGDEKNARISRGESNDTPSQPGTPTPQPASPLEASRTGMKRFIEESRSLLRDMDGMTDPVVYKQRAETVREAYSRIPTPPANNPALEECHKAAKQIASGFEVGNINLELLARAQQPEQKFVADAAIDGFRRLAGNLKSAIDDVESALAENRAPKPIPFWKN